MAEITLPTPGPAPAPEPKKNRPRHQVNQDWLDEFTFAEAIIAATNVDGRAVRLAEGDIDTGKITELKTLIGATRTQTSKAIQGTTDKEVITDDEDDFKTVLLEKIQYIQKRARQKYDATEPVRLADYGINQKLGNSRALLEQGAGNILLKLKGDITARPPMPSDVLPGVSPAKIAELESALSDYKDVQGNQSGAQGQATGWRSQVETAVADIVTRRREIQFAADAEWPHTDPLNDGIRVEFKLPADRSMK